MKKILALDLGITSLGYALLQELDKNSYRLLDYGVSMRDAPFDDKGNSFQSFRSGFKSSRDLIKKKRKRKNHIASIFERYSLSDREKLIESELQNSFKDKWRLRARDVFERRLSIFELFGILNHLAGHRGYKSISTEDLLWELELELGIEDSRDIKPKAADEKSQVKAALLSLEGLMKENPNKTVSTVLYDAVKSGYYNSFRNHDNYEKMLKREHISDEIEKIINSQYKLGFFEKEIDLEKFIKEIDKAVTNQPDPETDETLFSDCRFFKDEKVSSQFSYLYDLYKLYSRARDIKIDKHSITPDQFESIVEYVLDRVQSGKNVSELKYKDVRKILNLKDSEKLFGKEDRIPLKNGKFKENTITKFTFFAEAKKFSELIKIISSKDDEHQIYKAIFDTLQFERSPKRAFEKLKTILDEYQIDIDKRMILELIKSKKGKSTNISHKFIIEALPYLEDFKSESEIKEILGVKTEENYSDYKKGMKFLSIVDKRKNLIQYEIDEGVINNHPVKSTVAWIMRFVKHISSEYGLVDEFVLETTRNSLPREIKDAIEKAQKQSQKEIEDIIEHYKSEGFEGITKKVAKKIKYWREQKELDIYTGEHIGFDEILSNQVDLEHIVPQSLGGLTTHYNLVLTKRDTNIQKNNLLPMDFLNHDKNYNNRVENLYKEGLINWKKRKNLLAKDLSETFEEVRDSKGLRATSYIEKLTGEILKRYYPFVDEKSQKHGQNVRYIQGKVTSKIRNFWDIKVKSRDTNFHHAEDAIILALASRGWVQRVNTIIHQNYKKSDEYLKKMIYKEFPTIEGVLPKDIIEEAFERYMGFGEDSIFYEDLFGNIRSVYYWVSKKPLGTSIHKDTIYSKKLEHRNIYTNKKSIHEAFKDLKIKQNTKPSDFKDSFQKKIYDKLLLSRINPNDETLQAITKRADEFVELLEEFGSKKDKDSQELATKKIDELLKKEIVTSNGKSIRRVKFYVEGMSGFDVRGGIAEKDKNFIALKIDKTDDGKLEFSRVDFENKNRVLKDMKNSLVCYKNDILFLFTKKELKNYGKLVKFMEKGSGAKLAGFSNPRYPVSISKQPERFVSGKSYKDNAIKTSVGIIKLSLDITGKIKSFQKFGKIDDILLNEFLKSIRWDGKH